MFVGKLEQVRALLEHRDLLKKKIGEFKLQNKGASAANNRELIYSLKEKRTQKEN